MTRKSMNGREQTDALAKLAKPWQPDELAGFRVGDHVRLPAIDCPLIVVGFQMPSVLILRAPSGRELRAGWQAVSKVRTRAEIAESGP